MLKVKRKGVEGKDEEGKEVEEKEEERKEEDGKREEKNKRKEWEWKDVKCAGNNEGTELSRKCSKADTRATDIPKHVLWMR